MLYEEPKVEDILKKKKAGQILENRTKAPAFFVRK